MMGYGRVADSSDPKILPLGSPVDQRAYDPDVHPSKPFVSFDQPLYKGIACYVRLRPIENWEDIMQAHKKGSEPFDAGVEARPSHGPERLSGVNKTGTVPLPTFLIIGAQKSATRWLRINLGEHPQVFTADTESHFFSRDRFFRQGLDWYRAHFGDWDGEPIVGEATPGYMIWRNNPAKMAARVDESLPGVKLLALLRNPVDRAYSAFIHHMWRGRISTETDLLERVRGVAPEHDRQGLVAGGWYAASLAPYFERFGERLQVFLHDDALADSKHLYGRALEHIGASPGFVPP